MVNSELIIKVCGMRDADNIHKVEALGIDLMGFIFWPKSSRYVSRHIDYLPTLCKRVGVFVDQDIDEVRRIADEYALDYIQLHGHETPDYCCQLQGYRIIKAISIGSRDDMAKCNDYANCTDYFLFDTKCPTVGGSGAKFDWDVLTAYDGDVPFLLSGGIGPEDAEILASHPSPLTSKKCVGIDLNSRFETVPGIKDVAALRLFISEIRNKK